MLPWTFYPAFIGTLISIIAWSYLARKEHLTHLPRTLSELAAEKTEALRYYRIVLWTCGPLFAITMFAFVLPRISHSIIVGIVCGMVVIPEMVIGLFPAQRGKVTIHDIIAGVMGGAMVTLGYVFTWSLHNMYAHIELTFAICMSILALLCILNRKRYLFYELPLIYISHISVLVAAVAVR